MLNDAPEMDSTNAVSITSRPIHFTSGPDAVIARLMALGLSKVFDVANGHWQVFSAPAGGRIGVHPVETGNPLDGTSRLGFEVPNIESFQAITTKFATQIDPATGITANIVETTHGTALRITTKNSGKFLIDICPDDAVKAELRPGVEVSQMWFTPNTAEARQVIDLVGAAELVTTKGVGWLDTRSNGGGRTQIHYANSLHVSAGFMSAIPLEQLKVMVDAAGDNADIVDEAWGRYLAFAPATNTETLAGLDGELTWVNEEQTDYYGYQVIQNPIENAESMFPKSNTL